MIKVTVELLRKRHAEMFGVKNTVGQLPVSRAEIAVEAKKVHAKVSANMEDDTSEGDRIEAKVSSLAFDEATETHVSDSDSILSASERRQLAREIAQRRAVRAWLVSPTLLLTA